jgi:hypothetical protein
MIKLHCHIITSVCSDRLIRDKHLNLHRVQVFSAELRQGNKGVEVATAPREADYPNLPNSFEMCPNVSLFDRLILGLSFITYTQALSGPIQC